MLLRSKADCGASLLRLPFAASQKHFEIQRITECLHPFVCIATALPKGRNYSGQGPSHTTKADDSISPKPNFWEADMTQNNNPGNFANDR